RVRSRRVEKEARVPGSNDSNEFSLVGQIERIEAQDLAGTVDLRAERKRCLTDGDRHPRNAGDLVEDAAQPASPRVASCRQRRLGHASNMAATRLASGWQSLAMSPSKTSVPQESTSRRAPDM